MSTVERTIRLHGTVTLPEDVPGEIVLRALNDTLRGMGATSASFVVEPSDRPALHTRILRMIGFQQ